MAKIKCHHPHPVKAGSWNYGKSNTDPWVRYTIYSTVFETPRSKLCTTVVSRLRSKHTGILAWFNPGDFLQELKGYLDVLRIIEVGEAVLNVPQAELVDEEAWLF